MNWPKFLDPLKAFNGWTYLSPWNSNLMLKHMHSILMVIGVLASASLYWATKRQKAKAGRFIGIYFCSAKLGQGLSLLRNMPSFSWGKWVAVFLLRNFNCNCPEYRQYGKVFTTLVIQASQESGLKPLLAGDNFRSVFGMKLNPNGRQLWDATNMQATVELTGDELVLNGKKWVDHSLGHPNWLKLAIFYGFV